MWASINYHCVTSFLNDLRVVGSAHLVDAFVREEVDVDRVVTGDRLTRQNSEADSLLAGVLVQEVQIRRRPDEDDNVRYLEDATRGFAVKLNLRKKVIL